MSVRMVVMLLIIGAVAAAAYVFVLRRTALPTRVTAEQLKPLNHPTILPEFAGGTRGGNGAAALLRAAERSAGIDMKSAAGDQVLPEIAAAVRDAAEYEDIDLIANPSDWPALLELKRRPELYARLDSVRLAMTRYADMLWNDGQHDQSIRVTQDLGIIGGKLLSLPPRLAQYDLAYDMLTDASFRMGWVARQQSSGDAERWERFTRAARSQQQRIQQKANEFLWRADLRRVTGDLVAIAAGDGDRAFRIDATLLAGAATAKLRDNYPQQSQAIRDELEHIARDPQPFEAAAARRANDVTLAEANLINLP